MRFWIIDHITNIDYEYEWGTCELCARVAPAEFPMLTILWEDGTIEDIPLYYVDWGSVYTITFDNLFDFAGWLNEQPDSRFVEFFPWQVTYNNINLLSIDYEERES